VDVVVDVRLSRTRRSLQISDDDAAVWRIEEQIPSLTTGVAVETAKHRREE
jgi:hypothetical protein